MVEIRIHGRGGQGAVLAGGILAAAMVNEGKFVVAVPSFGFERRGAPVASFLRMDTREIRQMTNIYRPDCVLCIDPAPGSRPRPSQSASWPCPRRSARSACATR